MNSSATSLSPTSKPRYVLRGQPLSALQASSFLVLVRLCSTRRQKTPTDARGLFGGVAQRKGAAGAAAPDDPADSNPAPNANLAPVAFAEPGTRQLSEQLYPNLKVPPSRIGQRPADYAARVFEEVKPFCVSANDLINPLPPSMFSGSGWEVYHPPPGSADLSSYAHYWYSSLPTSKLRVGLQVGAGDIGIYYLKEPAGEVGLGSAVECWVDDNYAGAVVIENAAQIGEATPAYVFYSLPTRNLIAYYDIPGWRLLIITLHAARISSNASSWERKTTGMYHHSKLSVSSRHEKRPGLPVISFKVLVRRLR